MNLIALAFGVKIICSQHKQNRCSHCPSLPWQWAIYDRKESRWLKIEKEPARTVMSACLLRGLLNARCVVTDARVSGRRFTPVSWFLFFSWAAPERAFALLLCVTDEVTAKHRVKAHNTEPAHLYHELCLKPKDTKSPHLLIKSWFYFQDSCLTWNVTIKSWAW